MTAPAMNRRRGDQGDHGQDAPLEDPQAPGILHIDVAALAKDVRPALLPKPPARSALDEQLLEEARKCAGGDKDMPPRRELVAAALREIERQQWWRDRAEETEQALRQTRHDQLGIQFELVADAARTYRCDPSTLVVLGAIRAKGSGFIVANPLPPANDDRRAEPRA